MTRLYIFTGPNPFQDLEGPGYGHNKESKDTGGPLATLVLHPNDLNLTLTPIIWSATWVHANNHNKAVNASVYSISGALIALSSTLR